MKRNSYVFIATGFSLFALLYFSAINKRNKTPEAQVREQAFDEIAKSGSRRVNSDLPATKAEQNRTYSLPLAWSGIGFR